MRRFSILLSSVLLIGSLIPIALGFVLLVGPYVFAQSSVVASTPSVARLWPESGGRGQYVTLEGSNLGYIPGRVYFMLRGEEVDASIDFPTQCQNYWWRDNYVIVRVPPSLDPGVYKIKLKTSDGALSNETSFTVTTASPTPGICAVITDNGPAGVPLKIYGSNFGKERGRVTIGTTDLTIKDGDWSDSFISAITPPTGLSSGRLRIVDSKKTLSNPAFFTVGRCLANSCGAGQACCQDGTCRPSGACEDRPKLCTYGWSFSTGTSLNIGESCKQNEECSSLQCKDGKCVRGDKKEGASCRFDGECGQDMWCKGGLCSSPFRLVGQACKDNNECASQLCTSGRCVQGSKGVGAQCTSNDQCASKNCLKGACAQSKRQLQVEKITPSGTSVPRNAVPGVTFNQLVDTSTIPGCTTISPSMQGTWVFSTVGAGEDAKTVAELRPKNPLSSSTTYDVSVQAGCVKTLGDDSDGGMTNPSNSEFTSGTTFAPIESVRLLVDGTDKSRDIFTSAVPHVYKVELLAGGTVINPDDTSVRISWSASSSLLTIKDTSSGKKDEQLVVPGNKTGQVVITVSVNQTYQEGGQTKTKNIQVSREVEIDFCRNIWEYSDPTYQFDWSYCWDAGVPGSVKLPILVSSPQRVERSGLFEVEYLFPFQQGGDGSSTRNDDAISVRVIPNPEHYSPYLWYFKKVSPTGNPRPQLVDDFQAIVDAQGGTYVSTVRSDGKSYILFITANINASKETSAVLDSLLKRIHLANHVSDVNRATALRRDVLRMADINDIASFVQRYADDICVEKATMAGGECKKEDAREYPTLNAGTYIKGQSMSGWPSWQGTLGNLLSAAMPTDPYPGVTGVACVNANCICKDMKASNGVYYDAKTCFASNASKSFYFDSVENALNNDKVHAYTYTSSSQGASYNVCARLEVPDLVAQSSVKYCVHP